jgi:hypothetical protein
VLPCPTHTYTVTSGAIISVMRENTEARGVAHFTVTERPERVSLVDQNGTTYAMRSSSDPR